MKMKRIAALAVAAALTAGMLGGCGKKEKNYDSLLSKDDPTTITIWHYYNGVQLISFDEASVKKDSGADLPPDIFATYAETACVVDQLDGLADMSKYFTDDELDEYIDGYIEEGEFAGDGSLKIFPTS